MPETQDDELLGFVDACKLLKLNIMTTRPTWRQMNMPFERHGKCLACTRAALAAWAKEYDRKRLKFLHIHDGQFGQ